MKSEILQTLQILDTDPESSDTLVRLTSLLDSPEVRGDAAVTRALGEARRLHRERGDGETAARLIELEIGLERDPVRRAELWTEQGRIFGEELLRDGDAEAAFQRALAERPGDQTAGDALAHIARVREAWPKIVKKYLTEAGGSTDRTLTAGLHVSVAELHWRYQAGSPEVEANLRKALEVDPRHKRAAVLLDRLLRSGGRFEDLAAWYTKRLELTPPGAREERIAFLVALGLLQRDGLGQHEAAVDTMRKVLAIDAANPRAMGVVVDAISRAEDWGAVLKLYDAALKARPRGDAELSILIQSGMVAWRKLGQEDLAEGYFQRVRKLDGAHPLALNFYRAYHGERKEPAKLLQVLQQAQKAENDPARRIQLSVEMAHLAETSGGSVEKAIDLWKGVLKASPGHEEASGALRRLYERAEKWNSLLELHKEQIEALPKDTPEGIAQRIAKLLEVVAIYRDRVRNDMMVINTYNAILALQPGHQGAMEALAAKYEAMGRWNDLIGVLQRQADATDDKVVKAGLLRRIAGLWIDRFANHNQAVKPLEELYALGLDDGGAVAQLRDIYTRRKAWRSLLDLERKDLERLSGAERRPKLVEIAKLATERLGDLHESIALWNRLLEEDEGDPDALAALAQLYERERRYAALVEILQRLRQRTPDPKIAGPLLEKIGGLWVEKLGSVERGIEAYQEIVRLAPGQPKAVRVLRGLFAQTGDYDRLEALYADQGHWDELADTFLALAEQAPEAAVKVSLFGRAAGIALDRLRQLDRAAKAYERVLAVDAKNLVAARALVPIYRATEKWPRLLATYEILLGHATTDDERLEILKEIRGLCEERLGTKPLAFSWCAKAYRLRPADAELGAEIERLAKEADAWEELVGLYAEEVEKVAEGDDKIARYRHLAELSLRRLRRRDDAERYYLEVQRRLVDDRDASLALEEIYSQAGRHDRLLEVYRQRIESVGRGGGDAEERIELLFRVARIEEENVGDAAAAVTTYRRILAEAPTSLPALRALERIYGALGDAAGLTDVLGRQLELLLDDTEAAVGLSYRLGELQELQLKAPAAALEHYRRAFDRQPGHRPTVIALERYLAPGSVGRVDVAGLLVPVYEKADEAAKLVGVLSILLEASADAATQLELLRRLAFLTGRRLGEAEAAYGYGRRIFERVPEDADNRRELAELAEVLERTGEYAQLLANAETAAAERPDLARDLAWELGLLQRDRLHQPVEAEAAWRRVLALDARHEGAFRALETHYRSTEQWAKLRGLLVERKELATETPERRDLLFQVAEVEESVIGDPEAASRTYLEALEVDPSSHRAARALERLYTAAARWRDLDDLFARQVSFTEAPVERSHLKLRRAELYASQLDDAAAACDLYEEALAEDPSSDGARRGLERLLGRPELRLRAARLLEPLHLADGSWSKLVDVLRVQREQVDGREAVELLGRIAELQEERLAAAGLAFDTWREALRLEPGSEETRRQVERLGAQLDRHDELAAALEEASRRCDPNDLLLRGQLLRRAAQIYDEVLLYGPKAREIWRRLLDLDPSNLDTARPAAEALTRLYEAEESWAELVDVLRRQAEWAEPGEPRKEFLRRVGSIQEDLQEDLAAAIATHREILDGDPEDRGALDSLERLHAARAEWSELIEVLRRRLDLTADATARRAVLWQIAELTEQRLHGGHPDGEVISAYNAVLDEQPEDLPSLDALARLYDAAGRPADLLEVLDRRLLLARRVDERVGLRDRMAALLSGPLARPDQALERYREILDEESGHAGARAGLERLLGDEDLRLRAAEVLEPIYQGQGDLESLIRLHELWAEHAPDLQERITRLRRVAALREQGADRKAAFTALARAAKLAVAEAELGELLDGVERLANQAKLLPDLVALYRDLGPEVLDSTLQERVYLTVAGTARGLGDRDTAREYYRRVLDASAEHPKALDALEALYAESKELESLLEIYNRRADLAQGEDDRRRRYLELAAKLCAGALGRPSEAISAWEQVLELFPADNAAAKALEELYGRESRFADLADLLERRVGFADDLDEAVALRFRLGEIYERQLRDTDRAVENYRAAMGGEGEHAGAIGALERFLEDPNHRVDAAEVLEPIYAARMDWKALIRIYQIRLEAADDPLRRLNLTKRIARLYEEQLEDLEAAFHWFGRVFRENPADKAMREQLSRLAHILDYYGELAKIYDAYLEETYDESPVTLEILRTVAAIYDQRLGDVDKAKACYLRLLAHDAGDAQAFQLLESCLVRAGRWRDLLVVYREVVDNAADAGRRKALLFKICEINEQKLRDPAAAIEAYRSVLEVDPEELRAVNALDTLYQVTNRWHDLAELLTRQLDRVDLAGRLGLKLRLGEIYERRLEDLGAAIDAYEEVLQGDPGRREAVSALERLIVHHDHRLRIAQILEPIYKRQDDWSKLVVIYEAQLEFIEDKVQRVEMLREIARLQKARGNNPKAAMHALCRAWTEESTEGEDRETPLFQGLLELAGSLGAWKELIAVLEKTVDGSYDYDLVARVHARVADIHDHRLNSPIAAVDSWHKVVKVREDDAEAWKALERLLATLGRHGELVQVLERRGELSDDVSERKAIAYRAADLYEHTLAQPDKAAATWRGVLNLDDGDPRALDALVRLYEARSNWRELAQIYVRKIELVDGEAARRPLRFALAKVQEDKLRDPDEAIGVYRAVLDADGGDVEAIEALVRLHEQESQWPELLEALDRLAVQRRGGPDYDTIRYRAAKVIEEKQGEGVGAVERYQAILDDNPDHQQSRRALEALVRKEETREAAAAVLDPLYRMQGEWKALVELCELKLAAEHDTENRRTLLAQIADLQENGLTDLKAAFQAWARLIVESPEDDEAHAQLERIAVERPSFSELAALYEERLEAVFDPEVQRKLALKLAALYEERLHDDRKAISRYRKALDLPGDEMIALAALDRLLLRTAQHRELADVLAQEATAVDDAVAQAAFLHRLGELRRTVLKDLDGAVSAYRDALERDPGNAGARSALEGLLASDAHAEAALDILEPLAENDGDYGKQVMLAEVRLKHTDGATERASLLQRIAEIEERQLDRPAKASEALARALAEAPDDAQLADELERVSAASGRLAEVAETIDQVLTGRVSEDTARELGLRAARLYDRLLDASRAERRYVGVLEVDPENAEALRSLDRIYREAGASAKLVSILTRRAAIELEVPERRRMLAEVARLRQGPLADAAGAVAAWQQVLEVDEGDIEALDALAVLHESAGRFGEMVEVLEQKARQVPSAGEQVALKTRIAELYAGRINDLDRAVDAYRDLLDLLPDSTEALVALTEVQTRRKDWLAVQEVLVRHLGALPVGPAQIPIYQRLAELALERQKSPDDAVGYYQQILEIDPFAAAAREALERTLEKTEKWWDLVDALKQHAGLAARSGDTAKEVRLLVRAADLLESKLDAGASATEILEQILERDPRNVKVLASLARIYESEHDLEKCKATLERAVTLATSGGDAAEVYFRLGRLEEQRLGGDEGLAAAETYYQKAFEADLEHAGATAALEGAARRRGDWARVAELLEVRADLADEAGRRPLLIELARLHADKLGRPADGVPYLERAVELSPEDPAVLEPLADQYFAAGRVTDALPLYVRLIERLGKGRKTKDLARLHCRVGLIAEQAGDQAKAVEQLQLAQQIDAGHAPTLAALGRLYVAQKEWEKARKIYRAMLLQNLDPQSGVTKADVYLALGDIHERLSEGPKAIGMYERGLELEPGSSRLKEALARLKGSR